MTRVNPKARRHCFNCEVSRVNEYWVVNGTADEIDLIEFYIKEISNLRTV